MHHGLDCGNPTHIALLHWLFLPSINQDAIDWSTAWNLHKMSLPNDRTRSPYDMFMFGMITNGPRGISHLIQLDDADDVNNLKLYGVDWDGVNNPELMEHLLERSAVEHQYDNAGDDTLRLPNHMANVVCDPPENPFSPEQIDYLFQQLCATVDLTTRDMLLRHTIWDTALHVLNEFNL